MKKQRCISSKQKRKIYLQEVPLNEMKISDSPGREFKITVIKILTEVRRGMHEQSRNFNKEKILFKIPDRSYRAKEYNN